jgi:hypothetical protein
MTEEKSAGSKPSDPEPDALPGIDFSTLVLSLATSAMVNMGLVPETEGGPVEKNLALAHQSIDTLEMLQSRTRGNLSDDETKLLQSVLYELRMSYVKARG